MKSNNYGPNQFAPTFPDRGTGYSFFNGTTWTPCNGRIEPVKTGYGSMARFGANGVIVCSHLSEPFRPYLIKTDNRTGTNWTPLSIPAPPFTCGWPTITTTGPNHDIIHIVAVGQNSPNHFIYYCRSTNGGVTRDKQYVALPHCNASEILCINADAYQFLEPVMINGNERLT
jgi:hypothetical protein